LASLQVCKLASLEGKKGGKDDTLLANQEVAAGQVRTEMQGACLGENELGNGGI